MADEDNHTRQVTERELREAAVQMTASPPVGTSFIGFVPDAPPGYEPLVSPLGETTSSTPESEPVSSGGQVDAHANVVCATSEGDRQHRILGRGPRPASGLTSDHHGVCAIQVLRDRARAVAVLTDAEQ